MIAKGVLNEISNKEFNMLSLTTKFASSIETKPNKHFPQTGLGPFFILLI